MIASLHFLLDYWPVVVLCVFALVAFAFVGVTAFEDGRQTGMRECDRRYRHAQALEYKRGYADGVLARSCSRSSGLPTPSPQRTGAGKIRL